MSYSTFYQNLSDAEYEEFMRVCYWCCCCLQMSRDLHNVVTWSVGSAHVPRRAITATCERLSLLADRPNGRAYATVLRLSVVRCLTRDPLLVSFNITGQNS